MPASTILPWLLYYPMVAVLILRIVLGVTLIYFGYLKVRGIGQSSGSNSVTYGWAEIITGVMLVIGFFTQLAALINAVILIIKLAVKIKEGKFLSDGINYYLLLLAIAVALLFLSPGWLAIDRLLSYGRGLSGLGFPKSLYHNMRILTCSY